DGGRVRRAGRALADGHDRRLPGVRRGHRRRFRVVDGKTVLVSNTSIGPTDNTWLAGPQLGQGAKTLFDNMSKEYGAK
ncbi:hypothetical protein ACWD4T_43955, partial [Streptomyces umbrinus]